MLFKVGIYSLLRHIRCAHKINLLATSDFDDAIKNAPNNYYINFRQVFGKVTKLQSCGINYLAEMWHVTLYIPN